MILPGSPGDPLGTHGPPYVPRFPGDPGRYKSELVLEAGKSMADVTAIDVLDLHYHDGPGGTRILAAPPGYGFDEPFVQTYRKHVPQGELLQNGEPAHAVAEADVIYTDVWTSMGQEAERDERRKKFADFQVNEELLAIAPPHVRIMHCLPAHRGEEITDGVLDGPQSIAFEQAGNRMHAQKALLLWVMR